MGRAAKLQFNVEMHCQGCVESIRNVLKDVSGIQQMDFDMEHQEVVIQTTAHSSDILEAMRQTGKEVNISGMGEGSSAVSIIEGQRKEEKGVIRFIQITSDLVLVEGKIEGLPRGKYGVHIHQFGDISGTDTMGPHYNPTDSPHGGSFMKLGV
eukprot:TRINITY_DN7145_c0_g2_i1.p1 TRINITY_DN7145_c0_g2~~TRINITY_DN7145_c0_g2_i1.p1  ORF type:complete len:165 (+),score=42.24 TRINITY_DN7145_c0_g2_i1:39-497(+)